jgi:hypothetical protein
MLLRVAIMFMLLLATPALAQDKFAGTGLDPLLPDNYSCRAPDGCNNCSFEVIKLGPVYKVTGGGCTEMACLPPAPHPHDPDCAANWLRAPHLHYKDKPDFVNSCINAFHSRGGDEAALQPDRNEGDDHFRRRLLGFARTQCEVFYRDMTQREKFSNVKLDIFGGYLLSGIVSYGRGKVDGREVAWRDVQKEVFDIAVKNKMADDPRGAITPAIVEKFNNAYAAGEGLQP